MKIAICGGIASGKSTLARHLAEHRLQCTSFAKRLKELAQELYGMDPARKDRELLVRLGAVLRALDADVFVNATRREVRGGSQNTAGWVIDDLRFLNEYHALRREDWFIVKLDVSVEERRRRIRELYGVDAHMHLAALDHATEFELGALGDDAYDYVVRGDEGAPASDAVREHASAIYARALLQSPSHAAEINVL